KQIVLNLLINAIKFSHAGGEVAIVLRNLSGAITIDVVDHGIGMNAEEVRLAMTRFGQVASAWTRKHDGTGLGLPLAIGLTELHGGTLTVRSTAAVGLAVALSGLGRVSRSLGAASQMSEQAVLRIFVAALLFGHAVALATVFDSTPASSWPLPIAEAGLVVGWLVLLVTMLWPAA